MTPRRRASGTEPHLCGVLNLDKPIGQTSHDVVQQIRRLLGIRRVGHAGTLDPGASGVLPLLVGEATRFAEFLLHLGKTYEVVARLGLTTDTQDSSGTVLSSSESCPEKPAVLQALHSFLGTSLQTPPMYSALKVAGRRLHELAREGLEVERQPRRISVDSITDIRYQYPLLSFKISVSSGTYIRTICHDLGQLLGCGAIVVELRRVVVGPFSVDTSVSLETLQQRPEPERRQAVLNLEEVFSFLPAIRVRRHREVCVGHGQALAPADYEVLPDRKTPAEDEVVCILAHDGTFLAMGRVRRQRAETRIAPVRVLAHRTQASPEERTPPGPGAGLLPQTDTEPSCIEST